MNLARLAKFALLAMALGHALSFAESSKVENFRLTDTQGVSHELYRLAHAKAIVLFVHGLGCAVVDRNLAALNSLARDLHEQGVEFFLINSRPDNGREEIKKHSRDFNNAIPVLLDPAQVVARSLNFTRTAEALVIDPRTWTLVYRGPIDDGIRDYGTDRSQPQHQYLREAITDVVENKLDKIPAPGRSLGCLIHIDKPQVPSYAKQVGPILLAKCVKCHDGSNSSVWKMDRFESIREWAPMIRETLMARSMPPWWLDSPDDEFIDQGTLSLTEQRILFRWLEAGAPRGGGKDPLLAHRAKPVFKPDLILTMSEPIAIPAEGIVNYQVVKLISNSSEDLYIRGIQQMNPHPALHHATAFIVPAGQPLRGGGGGKSAKGGSFEARESNFFVNVGDNSASTMFDAPYALLIPKGYDLYMELHFKAIGRPESYLGQFGFRLAKDKAAKQHVLNHKYVYSKDFLIPAGDPEFKLTTQPVMFDHPITILAVIPHMHYRGKYIRISARYPDGHERDLVSVPDFRFEWQRMYQFKHPLHLPAGSSLVMSGAFDNSASNPFNPDPKQQVKHGRNFERTTEMFLGNIYYSEDKASLSAESRMD